MLERQSGCTETCRRAGLCILPPLTMVFFLLLGGAGGCSSSLDAPEDDVVAPEGSFESSPLIPSAAVEAALGFGAPEFVPAGGEPTGLTAQDFDPGELWWPFPLPSTPDDTTEGACKATEGALVGEFLSGAGEIVVEASGKKLVFSMYSPLSKSCEVAGEVVSERIITAMAMSPDRSKLFVAVSAEAWEKPLPESVIWRVDLSIGEEKGQAVLKHTLVLLSKLPCAPAMLKVVDLGGNSGTDFLAVCPMPIAVSSSGDSPDTQPVWVAAILPELPTWEGVGALLFSPIPDVLRAGAGDLNGDGLADIAVSGDAGTAYWLQEP